MYTLLNDGLFQGQGGAPALRHGLPCEGHLHPGERPGRGEAGHPRRARAAVVDELPPSPPQNAPPG